MARADNSGSHPSKNLQYLDTTKHNEELSFFGNSGRKINDFD